MISAAPLLSGPDYKKIPIFENIDITKMAGYCSIQRGAVLPQDLYRHGRSRPVASAETANRPRAAASRALPRIPGPAGRGRSEEHTSELPSLMRISYSVFCLKTHTT